MQFQSTLSVRRATAWEDSERLHQGISIHALRKESDILGTWDYVNIYISIHALRKESDAVAVLLRFERNISIHALRKESDNHKDRQTRPRNDFNPRSP